MHDYPAALEALNARAGELTAHRKFDLAHMRALLVALDRPETRFPSVLIAGTNGKGSTAATLASILQRAGLKTGLYTSPHLSRVNERVRVNGGEIADGEFAREFFRVERAAERLVADGVLPNLPSFFETLTAMAFLYFAGQQVDVAVLEVGLGGRLDATNVVEPVLSVITDIGLDHQEWLGNTLSEIAREKAGILRAGVTLVTLPQHPEVNQALGEVAVPLAVNAISAAEYVPSLRERSWRNRYPVSVLGETIEVDSPLHGQHQQRNIALAIAAGVALRERGGKFAVIGASAIADGIRETVWPGRLELVRDGRVLLDVAHNPAGAWALRSALSAWSREEAVDLDRGTLVFACLRDKPAEEMAQILYPVFGNVVLTRIAGPRALPPDELAERTRAFAREVVVEADAVSAVLAAEQRGPVVVAGSVYLVGAVRPAFTAAQDSATTLP